MLAHHGPRARTLALFELSIPALVHRAGAHEATAEPVELSGVVGDVLPVEVL
jgi:hypothetical protein